MKTLMLLLSLILSVNVMAETVYKTVDEDGNIIFTDKPTSGSEEIELDELQTIKNPNKPAYRPLPKKSEQQDSYQSLAITKPANDQGLRSNNGDFSVSVSLSPALKSGHRLIITMNGKEISNGTATSVPVKNADRGTHNLGARVVDGSGKTLISASSIFHLLRASQ